MATSHCLNHNLPTVHKIEGQHNLLVLPENTVFCVKGGTYNSGVLKADGETNLWEYLAVDKDVSYYVIYPEQPPTPVPPTTTTTTAPTTTTITGPIELEVTRIDASEDHNPLPGTQCVTPDGYPYTTSYPECPAAITQEPVVEVPVPHPTPLTELPHTGVSGPLVAFGVVLVLWGLVSILIAKLIAEGSR